jgi:hypothetical protein
MTELYKKIKIVNFEAIKSELLELVAPQISQNLRHWDVPLVEIYKSSPSIFNYIRENFYRFPILFRFYNSPPFYDLIPHIDNVPAAINKIGLNIPLAGTKNTVMNYYSTTADNLETKITGGLGGHPTQFIKDQNRLVLLDSFEVDQPTLLRTDAIHSVSNPNDSYRLILGMKFIGSTFEEVYKG